MGIFPYIPLLASLFFVHTSAILCAILTNPENMLLFLRKIPKNEETKK